MIIFSTKDAAFQNVRIANDLPRRSRAAPTS